MNGRVLVVGSSNTDMIVRLPALPKPGETVLGGEFHTAAGGKGANQAVAAARAGGQVAFIACLGRDAFGDAALAGFEADGIDTTHLVRTPDAPSGVALIFVDEAGENSIAVASGANTRLSPDHLTLARPAFEEADVMLVQLEIPLDAVRTAVEQAYEAGVRVVLNPAPAQALDDDLLRHVSVLTPNETEAETLTGQATTNEVGLHQAARILHGRGVETVLITLGRRGTFTSTAQKQTLIPAFPVEAVDTTAAGDVFNGALGVALAEGYPLTTAVRFANAAAALSVTRLGAQPSAPLRSEIMTLL